MWGFIRMREDITSITYVSHGHLVDLLVQPAKVCTGPKSPSISSAIIRADRIREGNDAVSFV